MSDGKSIVPGVGGRYATALFDLALDNSSTETVENDLNALAGMLADSDELNRMVQSPARSREEQGAAMGALADTAGFDALTKNFLGLVASNRRLLALSDMINDFRTLARDHRGEISAEVTSAHALNDKQLDAIKAHLKAAMGRDVQVDASVDEDLLGGLIVKVGSRMIDNSIRTKLENVQLAMREAP